jgi:hypothetical protein
MGGGPEEDGGTEREREREERRGCGGVSQMEIPYLNANSVFVTSIASLLD